MGHTGLRHAVGQPECSLVGLLAGRGLVPRLRCRHGCLAGPLLSVRLPFAIPNGHPWAVAIPAGPTGASRATRPVLGRSLRIGAYALAGLALARLLWTVDLRAVAATLGAVGPMAALALLPLGLQMLLEAGSWRLLLAKLGHLITWGFACRVSLQAEAIRLSFPGGPPLSEGMRPVLFARHRSVPLSDGASSLVVRKLCHMASQGAFLCLGATLGSVVFERWAQRLGPAGRVLPVVIYVAVVALTLGAVLMGLMLFHGSVATCAERMLTRVTRGRLARFLEDRRSSYATFDSRLRLILWRHPASLFWNLSSALGGYLLDAIETLLIIRLLGFRVGFGEAVALEALVSVIRSAAFAVPGGLGIQDFSYHALLQGTVGDAASMSLILLKRGRDAFWVATGFVLPLLLDRLSGAGRASSGSPAVLRELSSGAGVTEASRTSGGVAGE